jgi:hypothetical protein
MKTRPLSHSDFDLDTHGSDFPSNMSLHIATSDNASYEPSGASARAALFQSSSVGASNAASWRGVSASTPLVVENLASTPFPDGEFVYNSGPVASVRAAHLVGTSGSSPLLTGSAGDGHSMSHALRDRDNGAGSPPMVGQGVGYGVGIRKARQGSLSRSGWWAL